jgi:hypothetical protein
MAIEAANDERTAETMGVEVVAPVEAAAPPQKAEAAQSSSSGFSASSFFEGTGTQPEPETSVGAGDAADEAAPESALVDPVDEDEADDSDQERLYRLVIRGGAEKNIAMPDGTIRSVMARLMDRNYTLSDGQVLNKGDVAYVLKGENGQAGAVIESLSSMDYQARLVREHGLIQGSSGPHEAEHGGTAVSGSERVSFAERLGSEVAGAASVVGKAALGLVAGGAAGVRAMSKGFESPSKSNPSMDEGFAMASRQVPALAEWRAKGMAKIIQDGNALLTMADHTMRGMGRDPVIRNLRQQIGEINSGDTFERQQQKSMMIDEMQRHIRSDPRLSAMQQELISYSSRAERKFSIAADQAGKYGMTEELRMMLDAQKMGEVSLRVDEFVGDDTSAKSDRIREAAQKLIAMIQEMFRTKQPSFGPSPTPKG